MCVDENIDIYGDGRMLSFDCCIFNTIEHCNIQLATKFMAVTNAERSAIAQEASNALSNVEDEKEQKSIKFYVKVMNRVISKGEAYLATEPVRLKKLMGSQISDGKKQEFQRRLNILTSFPKGAKEGL